MILGLSVPGTSWLHRAPAGAKLLGLALFGTVIFLISDYHMLAALFGGLALLYWSCGLGFARFVGQIKALGLFLVIIGLSQTWLSGWESGLEVTLRLAIAVTGASLVTYTTPFSEMSDVLERVLAPFDRAPLSRLGLRPASVAFALTMTVRFLPVMEQVIGETRQAAAARGRERNWIALILPSLIRTLKMAHEVGEAVEARGLESFSTKNQL
ncbi:MAG: energy-coupling factor transporter transmembrane component T family protein [Rhodospirillaceae bacterium]